MSVLPDNGFEVPFGLFQAVGMDCVKGVTVDWPEEGEVVLIHRLPPVLLRSSGHQSFAQARQGMLTGRAAAPLEWRFVVLQF